VKAFRYQTGTRIAPFGDDVADSQVLNQSLSACQRRACQPAGLTWRRIDSLYFSEKVLGDVQVIHRGQKVGTGKAFLACCIGHRAVLGARVLIHAGREIPNDLLMVSRPEDVVAHIPPDLPANTPLVRHEGGLVPLKNLRNRPT
jgi:hypothetical protein